MAVKVWDASAGAFKDAETPMIWDEASGAYKNSTGLVYDENSSAWSERWGSSKRLYIIKDGIDQGLVGGWTVKRVAGNTSYKWDENGYMTFSNQYGAGSTNFYCSNKSVEKNRYKGIFCTAHGVVTNNNCVTRLVIARSNERYVSPYTQFDSAIIKYIDIETNETTIKIALDEITDPNLYFLIQAGVLSGTASVYVKDLWLE